MPQVRTGFIMALLINSLSSRVNWDFLPISQYSLHSCLFRYLLYLDETAGRLIHPAHAWIASVSVSSAKGVTCVFLVVGMSAVYKKYDWSQYYTLWYPIGWRTGKHLHPDVQPVDHGYRIGFE